MVKIDDRMPVILPEGARDRWLDATAGEAEVGFSSRFQTKT